MGRDAAIPDVSMGTMKESTGRQKFARYVSPLRYPGGKGKVANFIKLLVLENSFQGRKYIEPYAGGASVALSLLLEGYVSTVHINDLNRGVYAFWKTALRKTDFFCARIMEVDLSVSEWRRQREIYADPSSSLEDLGFATFYLNRTNRSGIVAGGGLIGGLAQDGKWKMDARFDRASLCERISSIAKYRRKITLSRMDAGALIRSPEVRSGESLIYLDPPYYVKGSGLYDNFYTHQDHVNIRAALEDVTAPWIVSYDAAPEILELYKSCSSIRYQLGYSAAAAGKGTEVMFFSDDLKLPEVASPAGITSRHIRQARARFDAAVS
ncbi:DNA adenine methylase [Amycolatopsis granulosa]|uniref:DNA adenine methylase n=1 Tax=Amycolatopsis granulosa TaxID=185684 RepID=UPI001ABBB6A7|nr:DNA adenine methylase [Amycolatopsis granulosa]NIH86601.1 DNA adenine methylase [Amycolatopsis granulosa]